jgi:5-methylcytosine-specific restriction endonuclease McrBC GTP-binding regulatory subunit McrB
MATKTNNSSNNGAIEYKNEYSEKVIKSKNVIFHGAPGTGKTYLAKEIAADIISDGKTASFDLLTSEQKKQFAFVQFHPSYDYTDFVEGLRPVEIKGQLIFKLEKGIFKEFVDKAINPQPADAQDNFEEAWSKFYEEVKDNEPYEIKNIIDGKPFIIATYKRIQGVRHIDIDGCNMSHDQIYKVYKGQKGMKSGKYDGYRKAVVKHMKENFGLKEYIAAEAAERKFVFVIDEINRGEISKIFGELFFSIDPGYRGEKGAVLTQYSNMHEDPNEKFYIPDNVYIIGTMNDIDRSVDSFDFAMRRRFRFIEIKAKETDSMLDSLGDKAEEAKSRMDVLNNAITDISELGSNYHIGAAYFLKLQDVKSEELWTDYLKPLLQEYIRGTNDESENLTKLEDAYNAYKRG